ncbi:MAG TPA: allantoinase AllB [Bryobacteraceae bacterium]|nr:allantoinase AllB [Bryobacteraceae bacterium]
MFDLVIHGGQVVTPQGSIHADVGVEDGLIAAIGPELSGGKHRIDALGHVVLPGLIDVHLHFNDPGRADWEGAATGSRALAAGGGTLFFDMPLNSTPCTVTAAEFDRKRAALEEASITDFALWGGIVPGNLGEMAELAGRGVIGFKAFLCDSGLPEFPRADDVTLLEGMREAARLGLPVAVHAESEEITKTLTQRMLARGRRNVWAFLESRPVVAEVEAIQRAGLFARETRCRLHIVHVSSGSGVAAALDARALGADVSIETCPHYLMFSEEDLERMGGLAKCTPPLRSIAEQSALVACVESGSVDIVASDHSPCPPEMKQRENFFEIWGGIAGVQFTRAVLFDKGLTPEQVAKLTATHGAARFGIRDKGTIETGKHADLSIVNLHALQHVREDALYQRHRGTPYMGMTLGSKATHTIRRGEIIYSNGAITAEAGGELVRPGV